MSETLFRMPSIIADVMRAVSGIAQCCNKTVLQRSPWYLDLMADLRWIQRRSPYKTMVIMVPLDMCCAASGLWFSHNNIIIIIIFPTEARLWNCLVFWWAGLVPFLVQPLHFRLQVVHSPFISSHCGCQEALIFCIIAEVPDRCPHTLPPFQESVVDTLWNCTTSWTMWWAEPRLMSNTGTAVFVLTQWFLPNDAFSLSSWLQCYDCGLVPFQWPLQH